MSTPFIYSKKNFKKDELITLTHTDNIFKDILALPVVKFEKTEGKNIYFENVSQILPYALGEFKANTLSFKNIANGLGNFTITRVDLDNLLIDTASCIGYSAILISDIKNLKIDGINCIYSEAFRYSTIENLEIKNTAVLDNFAFANASFNSITLENVERVPANAFAHTQVKNLTFKNCIDVTIDEILLGFKLGLDKLTFIHTIPNVSADVKLLSNFNSRNITFVGTENERKEFAKKLPGVKFNFKEAGTLEALLQSGATFNRINEIFIAEDR